MLRRLFAIVALVLLGAQSPIASFPPGAFTGRAALSGGGVSGCTPTCPAELGVGSALAYWSLYRCYSKNYVGNVADVYAPLDASHTLITCSANGVINETLQSLATTCAVSCTVKTLYDQSGANNCGGPCDATNATIATRPTVTLSGLGSFPVMVGNGSSTVLIAASWTTSAEPNWVPAVVIQVSFTAQSPWMGDGAGNMTSFFSASNTAAAYAGATVTGTAANNAWHAIQSIFNGASSNVYVDGTDNTGNDGGGSIITSVKLFADAFSNFYNGKTVEISIWHKAPSAGDKSTMNSNQHSYWSF